MRRWRYQAAVAVTLVVMAGYMGYIAIHDVIARQPRAEIFPFFNWDLFSKPQRVISHYEILIDRVSGKIFIPPVSIQEMPEYPAHLHGFDKAVQMLGSALQSNNPTQVRVWRYIIENQMHKLKDVDYRIVKVTYDPLVRLETNNIMNETILAEYHFNQTP